MMCRVSDIVQLNNVVKSTQATTPRVLKRLFATYLNLGCAVAGVPKPRSLLEG
jgi:hypothetical protein